VLETIRVADGAPVLLSAHLARLWASCEVLELPRQADLEARIRTAAATLADGALRVHMAAGVSQVRTRALPARPPVMTLEPVVLPGGLGEHKWADRALIDSLSSPERTPLFCDLDGAVLEAGYAAVMILNGTTLTAPPLDGRLLPSVAREQALAAARAAGLEVALESFGLQELRHADAVVLCSSLRGPHAGAMAGTAPAAAQRVCERLLRAAVDR
jgi:para-aminobenzoate synthetase/4-amino-4-deoxychorismate lyase